MPSLADKWQGYRGHGRGEFVKATVTDYTSRFQANEAWRVEFVYVLYSSPVNSVVDLAAHLIKRLVGWKRYNETGEKGVVTLDNHFEEVRLLC